MKTLLRSLALSLVIAFCVSHLLAQTVSRDVVYLKNGSIIKGTILELIMDKTIKIQTADGSIFVYAMLDVDKIEKEPYSGNDQGIENRPGGTARGAFSIFAGAAIPSGDFGNAEGGGAKTGYVVGAQIATNGSVGLLIIGSYSQNKTEFSTSNLFTGLKAETGNWTSILALAGIKLGTDNPTGGNIFVSPLIGALFGRSPDEQLTFTETIQTWNGYSYEEQTITATASQASVSSTAVAYGGALEIEFGKTIAIGARYIVSKPKYEVSATAFSMGYSNTQSATQEQKTEIIQVYLGIAF